MNAGFGQAKAPVQKRVVWCSRLSEQPGLWFDPASGVQLC
jgi:hypothetical protein